MFNSIWDFIWNSVGVVISFGDSILDIFQSSLSEIFSGIPVLGDLANQLLQWLGASDVTLFMFCFYSGLLLIVGSSIIKFFKELI